MRDLTMFPNLRDTLTALKSQFPSLDYLRRPHIYIPLAISAYIGLVRALRFRRVKKHIRHFAKKKLIKALQDKKQHGITPLDYTVLNWRRELLNQMTAEDAWPVMRDLMQLEFPSIFPLSLFFALFKTYGIPSISTLLCQTSELSNSHTASKRAADTGILISEFVLNPPTSTRTLEGLSRMNYLHSQYQRAGKISNDDMLYTLSLFALEPYYWIEQYEWRPLTEFERGVLGTTWKDIGEAMDIDFTPLEPLYADNYRDGLAWHEAIESWSTAYEKSHMLPAPTNAVLARETMALLTFNTPRFLKPLVTQLFHTLMSPRLRKAMLIPAPPSAFFTFVSGYFRIRRFVLLHLSLPRPWSLRVKTLNDAADTATGRYHTAQYISRPWYIKPTFWARWGPAALMHRFIWRGIVPGEEKYFPAGYAIKELGPERSIGKGVEEIERGVSELRKKRGCPMGLGAEK